MSGGFEKSISARLGLAAKLHRARATTLLARIGLYPGQETILKALAEEDGRTMGELATALSVRPPTITKMVARLGAQGYVERRTTQDDARLGRVFLTDTGQAKLGEIDEQWKELERQSVDGLDAKDRKRLRKLLRQVARNLGQIAPSTDDPELDEHDDSPQELESDDQE